MVYGKLHPDVLKCVLLNHSILMEDKILRKLEDIDSMSQKRIVDCLVHCVAERTGMLGLLEQMVRIDY